jgi:hypothetical protein
VEAVERAEVAAEEEEVLVHPAAVGDHHHPTPSGILLLSPTLLVPFSIA